MSLNAIHGKGTFVVLNTLDATDYLQKVDTPYTSDAPDTTTFGHDSRTHIPGLKDGSLSAEGFYDGLSGAVDEVLNNILAGQSPTNLNHLVWFPGGNTAGTGYGMEMIQTAYNVQGTKDDATKISLAGISNVGRERLKMVHPLKVEVATATGDTIDLLAAGTGGCAGYLHITGVTGSGSAIVKIEQSTNGSAWEATALLTFTTATAATHERKVPTGTTVMRYVRSVVTISGFTDVNCLVAICKK